MGILPIGGVLINDSKAKLVSSAKLAKTLFSDPKMTDTMKEFATGTEAQTCLKQFGSLTKSIKLNPKHAYKYINAHGAAQLFDVTAQKNVVTAVKKLKKPITTLVRTNILDKIFKK